MPRLLVVHHSPTAATNALLEAVVAGAGNPELSDVEVVVRSALAATADDVLAADGYLLGTPANFGYMSGALKHFFDSTFLAIGGALDASGGAGEASFRQAQRPEGQAQRPVTTTAKRPFGLFVHGRYDTTGAVRSVLSIVQALGWRQVVETLEVTGDVGDRHREAARELGATVAANL